MRRISVRSLAPAKINLTLHVVGRRTDGYHLLDSLVVFVDLGDSVGVEPAARTSLRVTGPFAGMVPAGEDNLVVRAARLTGSDAAITLHKVLPAGAGIGGGSSDAAAVLRAISAVTGRPPPDALRLGADVPVCVAARPARMRDVGEMLEMMPPLPELPMVLVYPGVAVSTAAVFAGLGDPGRPPMPDAIPVWATVEDAAAWLVRQRNDLETPALRQAPVISEARAALIAEPGCLMARMSGSGSTIFGLFATPALARRAASRLEGAHPGWWVRAARTLADAPKVQESRVTT